MRRAFFSTRQFFFARPFPFVVCKFSVVHIKWFDIWVGLACVCTSYYENPIYVNVFAYEHTFVIYCVWVWHFLCVFCFCLWHFCRLCTGHFMTLADLSDLYDKNSVVLYIFFHLPNILFHLEFAVDAKWTQSNRSLHKKCDTWEHKNKARKYGEVDGVCVFFLVVVINEQHRMPESASNGFPYCMLRDHLGAIIDVLYSSSPFRISFSRCSYAIASEKALAKNALWTTNRMKLAEQCTEMRKSERASNNEQKKIRQRDEKSTWLYRAEQQVFCQRFSDANLLESG